MDMIARRALERPDVKADGAPCNPRQHSSCLARGAVWSQDGHDAIASSSGGSVTKLSVTGRYRLGAVIEPACTSKVRSRWSILLTSEKLNKAEARKHSSVHYCQ